MRLELEVFGDTVIARELVRYREAVTDMRPAFRKIARRLERAAERQFASEGSYGSGGWEALKPSTLAAKKRKGQPAAILQATGALKASLAGEGAGHIEEFDRDQMRWGSTVPYGRFHQSGTSRMPRRRVVELPAAERRNVMRELQVHITENG